MSPLSVTTNIFRHPKLYLGTSNKAAPTVQVSFSNANAQREAMYSLSSTPVAPLPIQSNCIPFPSQPIQCPRISSSHADLEHAFAGFENWLIAQSSPSVSEDSDIWYGGLGAPQHRVPSSFVHRDSHSYSSEDPIMGATDACGGHVSCPAPRKRKMAVRRVKVPHYSAKAAKRTRRARTTRKTVVDVQFAATLHRSILAHLQTTRLASNASKCEFVDCADEDEDGELKLVSSLRTQDHLLVERLWKNLTARGYSPTPLYTRAEDADMFNLRHERVDHVFQTEPISLGLPSEYLMDVEPAPQTSRDPATCPTIPQETPSPECYPEILTLSQLVSSLILNYRDRTSSRRRNQCSTHERHGPGRSPLSNVIRFHAHRGRK